MPILKAMSIEEINRLVIQKCEALSIAPPKRLVWVSIREQRLRLIENGVAVLDLPASTSRNPPSCERDSFGTPIGLHAIGAKIGGGAPEGCVFKGRVAIARHYSEMPSEAQAGNLITSRILRLRGLDPELNAREGHNAWERYVYIHGTNHEERLGEPFSGGCVELANSAVIALFRLVDEGDLVWISLE